MIEVQTPSDSRAWGSARFVCRLIVVVLLVGGERVCADEGHHADAAEGERGISLSFEYVSTLFVNAQGGTNTNRAIEYSGNTHLTLTFDTSALDWWEGGELFIYGEERHGSGISERHVGDIQLLNNDEDRDFVQVTEYWWRQEIADGGGWFKIGKIDAAADFQVVEYGLEFINSSFGVIPNVPVPTFPDTAVGAIFSWTPAREFYLMGGVFDQEGYGGTSGLDTAFHGRDDVFAIGEVGMRMDIQGDGVSYPGTYRFGGWYSSGIEDVLSVRGDEDARVHRGNSGLYLAFDQLVYKEVSDPDDGQGIGLFFQFGWAPSRYNEISQYYGAGMQWVGMIPSRDDDIMGLAVGHISLSGDVQAAEQRHSETVVEWFYKAQLTPWLSIMPDLQYIVNPGGDGSDAFVVGLRTQVSF